MSFVPNNAFFAAMATNCSYLEKMSCLPAEKNVNYYDYVMKIFLLN